MTAFTLKLIALDTFLSLESCNCKIYNNLFSTIWSEDAEVLAVKYLVLLITNVYA